jgi:hypothetical protein
LQDFVKPSFSAEKIEREVAHWHKIQARFTTGHGRAAFAARLGTLLRYLGAYRILKVHAWNRLPPVPDIALFTNKREWNHAQEVMRRIIKSDREIIKSDGLIISPNGVWSIILDICEQPPKTDVGF